MAGNVAGRAIAVGAVAHRLGIGAGALRQLLERLDARIRRDHQHHRHRDGDRDGHEILERIKAQLGVDVRVDAERGGRAVDQVVAIGPAARRGNRADVAARAGAVVNHQVGAQALVQAAAQQAGHDVGVAAGCERHHDGDRLVRIAAGGGTRGQRQAQGSQRGGSGHGGQHAAEITAVGMHGSGLLLVTWRWGRTRRHTPARRRARHWARPRGTRQFRADAPTRRRCSGGCAQTARPAAAGAGRARKSSRAR